MPHIVFISYSKEDRSIVENLCSVLENSEIKCWMAPRDITPGISYPKAIISAIRESSIVLFILSKYSNKSQQVIRELERAVALNIPIIPFRVEEIALTEEMEYFISTTQWLEGYPPPVEDHIPKLISAIKKNLNAIKHDDGNSLKIEKIESKIEKIEDERIQLKNAFICYSNNDSEKFQISKISKHLKTFKEINEIIDYKDVISNNIESLEEKIKQSDFFLYFCSQNALKMKEIEKAWTTALFEKKVIIPIYKNFDYVPLLLKPNPGVHFTVDDSKLMSKVIHSLMRKILKERD